MNIYVGNLSFQAREEDVRQAFAAFGEVASVSVIKDQFTGQSRGFAFVEMPNQAEGEAAIAAINGKELKGRAVKVNEARPREAGAPRGERRSGGGGFSSGDRGNFGERSNFSNDRGGYSNDRGGYSNDRGGFGGNRGGGFDRRGGNDRNSGGGNDRGGRRGW